MSNQTLIRIERIIDATPAAVFQVLEDFDRYPEWNEFTEQVITERRVGGPVVLHVNMPGKRRRIMHERFTGFVPGRRISWGVRWGGGILLDCDRVQEIEATPEGRTRYVTYEEFNGLLGTTVVHFYGESVRRGFELCADSLARRMKALGHGV